MRLKDMVIKAGMVALLLCLALTPVSCGSDKTGGAAEIEVEQRQPSIEHTISSDNLEIVEWLFEKNGLDLDHYKVVAFNINTACSDNLEASYYGVGAIQIYKGLPVFVVRDERVGYWFNRNGDLVYTADFVQIHDVGKEFSIEPAVSTERAQQIAVEAYPLELGSHELTAELGFVDKQAISGEGGEPEYALIWKITHADLFYEFFAIVDATNADVLCAIGSIGM